MVILLSSDKSLLVTKRTPVYKFETGVDDIKFIIPPTMNNIDMSELKCVILVSTTDGDGVEHGLFKYLAYDEKLYKNMLTTSVPITTTLTKNAGNIKVWLLFLKSNPDNPKLADNVMETRCATFSIIDNESKYAANPDSFDEIWEHSTIDVLQKDVDKLSDEVNKKADNITLEDNNVIVLRNGDEVLASVQLADDVLWEEWR